MLEHLPMELFFDLKVPIFVNTFMGFKLDVLVIILTVLLPEKAGFEFGALDFFLI